MKVSFYMMKIDMV